jgi:hypothetical protein
MNALSEGTTPPAPNPTISGLIKAARHDADAFRAMLETVMCLALPQEVMARPHVAAKIAEFERHVLPPDLGIDREQLMSLLDGRADVSSVPSPVATRQRESRAGAR